MALSPHPPAMSRDDLPVGGCLRDTLSSVPPCPNSLFQCTHAFFSSLIGVTQDLLTWETPSLFSMTLRISALAVTCAVDGSALQTLMCLHATSGSC